MPDWLPWVLVVGLSLLSLRFYALLDYYKQTTNRLLNEKASANWGEAQQWAEMRQR